LCVIRNLENEDAKVRYGTVENTTKRVVIPGKQNNKQIIPMHTTNSFRTIKLAKTYFVDKITNSGLDKFVHPLLANIKGIDT